MTGWADNEKGDTCKDLLMDAFNCLHFTMGIYMHVHVHVLSSPGIRSLGFLAPILPSLEERPAQGMPV